MHRALLVAVAVSGCYSPSYKDCQFQCSSVDTCPAGMECKSGVCRLEGMDGTCAGGGPDGGSDAQLDAPPDPTLWSTPQEVILSGMGWSSPTLNADESEMFVENAVGAILRSTRNGQVWSSPLPVAGLEAGNGKRNVSPMLTRDGLAMYFGSDRNSATNTPDVFRATRASASAISWPMAGVLPVGSLNDATTNDNGGALTASGELILFTSDRGGDIAIFQSTFAAPNWTSPTRVTELDSPGIDGHPSITGDGLTVVFTSNRLGADYDIYIATRTSLTSAFSMPRQIPALSQPAMTEVDPWISVDGRVIYFAIGGPATRKIYRSMRL